MRKLLVATFVVTSAFFYASSASALGGSAGLLVGNGFEDVYKLGIGARAGITLPMSLYVGGTFVYHLGKTESTPAGDVAANAFYFGPEGGYDFGVGPLTLRPYLGLGYSHFRVSAPDSCIAGVCVGGSNSEGRLAFWPGAAALMDFAGIFAGVDARYIAVVDLSDANAFAAYLTGGLTF
jgi:hypothetical protein